MKKWILLSLLLLPACMPSSKAPNPETQSIPYSPHSSVSTDSNPTSTLKITVLNVGQGDATLVQSPSGKTLLIDAGNDGKGREVIVPFLRSQQIEKIDAMVLSHYDADHMAGLDEVLESFPPALGIFDRGEEPMDESFFYPAYANSAAPFRKTLRMGESLALDAFLQIRCVAVNGNIWPESFLSLEGDYSQKENAASIALRIEYGSFSYLSAGDLTGGGAPGGFPTLDLESPLAQSIGHVTALHANHHGSLTSSNASFVSSTRPQVVLFSVGDGNDYHHPAQEVLERWKEAGADLWLTEKGSGGFISDEHVVSGNIVIETNGEWMKVNNLDYILNP